jgi:zinc and cadmium transporter
MSTTLPLLLQIIAACLLGGLLSVFAAFAVMYGLPRRWLMFAVSFAAGLMLANSFLHLLPEAMESGLTPDQVFPLLLGGILSFFVLERFTLWRHSHHHDGCPHAAEQSRQAPLILIGDAFHNFTDGILLAAAFLADPMLGWSTTLAVIAHEVPQEAGDFALLLAAGWNRGRALFWNGISSLAAVAGGVVGFFVLAAAQSWVPTALTLAAAGFIYIAVADLLPRLRGEQVAIPLHMILIGCGVAVIVLGNSHSH